MDVNYLCHYGVLGMKWGVRKDRSRSSSGSSKSKRLKKTSKITGVVGSKTSKSNKKKKTNIKKLSDQALQNKVRRLQLEKQYRDLKKDEVSDGRKILGEILKTSGKTLGIQVSNYLGGKIINSLFGDEVIKNVGKKKNKKKDKQSEVKETITFTDKKNDTVFKDKYSKYNESAYKTWYDSAKNDPYTKAVNDFKNKKTTKQAAQAVIVNVQDVKVKDLPALPPPKKKRSKAA